MTQLHQALIEAAVAEQPGTGPLTCREASIHSRETFIPCGIKADRFVLSERGTRVYPMCAGCANHNCRNRGAEDLGPAARPARTA